MALSSGTYSLGPGIILEREDLPNGMRLIFIRVPGAWQTTAHLALNYGMRHEHAGSEGLAHLLEHMVSNGGPRYRLARRKLSMQSDLQATTGWSCTSFGFSGSGEAFDAGLPSLLRMVFEPAFEEGVLRSERDVIWRERMGRAEEGELAILYPRSERLRVSLLGRQERLDSVKVEDLARLHAASYSSDRAVLALCGAIEERQCAAVRELCSALPRRKSPALAARADDFTPRAGCLYLEPSREGSAGGEASVRLMAPISFSCERDLAKLRILERLLWRGDASRLYSKARWRSGLAYYWSCALNDQPEIANLSCAFECHADALREIGAEYRRAAEELASSGPGAEELEHARARSVRSVQEGLRACDLLAEWAANIATWGRDFRDFEDPLAARAPFEAGEIRELAAELLTSGRMLLWVRADRGAAELSSAFGVADAAGHSDRDKLRSRG